MDIIVFVPENAVIESVTPPFKAFSTANEFLAAENKQPLFHVRYAGMTNAVSANNNTYRITTQVLLNEVEEADLLFLPALNGDIEIALAANMEAIPSIQRLYKNGTQIASLCVGAFLLAEAGLNNGKKCSTHWAYYDLFKERYPEVEIVDGSIITDEGTIYSSGGANSIWNLILYLIEKFAGRDIAVRVSKFLAIDIDRSSQAAFTIFMGQKNHNDPEIKKTQELMEKHFADKLAVSDLAAQMNVSRKKAF